MVGIHEYVDWVLKNGVMNGVGGGLFEPNGETTRRNAGHGALPYGGRAGHGGPREQLHGRVCRQLVCAGG